MVIETKLEEQEIKMRLGKIGLCTYNGVFYKLDRNGEDFILEMLTGNTKQKWKIQIKGKFIRFKRKLIFWNIYNGIILIPGILMWAGLVIGMVFNLITGGIDVKLGLASGSAGVVFLVVFIAMYLEKSHWKYEKGVREFIEECVK